MPERFWILRLFDGVIHSFPDRKVEWVMAIGAFLWAGRWLVDPADNFYGPDGKVFAAYRGLQYLFSVDWLFAGGMFVAASLRLAALTVNGTFYETWYARWSPLVRAITAALCGVAWSALWISSTAGNTQGSVTFGILVAIDFLTAYFVVNEGADALRDWWRHGRSGRKP